MKLEKIKIGNKEVFPFTIPSGIITTEVSSIERIANEIPELGIITTKSIGLQPRVGNPEPILLQYASGCFMNAVGLTNLGVDEFAKKISKIKIPDDKFLLASSFGKNAEEFVKIVQKLDPYVDGHELNGSCPHAKGYGMQIGQDPAMVGNIVREVVRVTKKPVFFKVTPNTNNGGMIAKSAMYHGATGITGINTVGPGYYSHDGFPVLSNKVGGMSGAGILPIGLKCIKEIRDSIKNGLIIGGGGIRNAQDVIEYIKVGADVTSIGSALAGLTENELKLYFSTLVNDLENETNNAEKLLKTVDMNYKKVCITDLVDTGCNFKLIKTNLSMHSYAGQFVFVRIPEIGEKPFSIMDNNPLTLGILERGIFTKAITSLKKGDSFYVRGPYGQSVPNIMNSDIGLVGGGCGIAGLYLIVKQLHETNSIDIFLGAKDKDHIPYIDEFKKFGCVHIATEDGSLGHKGLITDLLNNDFGCKYYFKLDNDSGYKYYFNCGPRKMIDAILPIQLKNAKLENIYSSIDYMTRCGVGICGSCADDRGLRTCVEGPFMSNSRK